jgi:parallel beta-helix repeat protein
LSIQSQGEDDPDECDVRRDPATPFLTINGAINQRCIGLENGDTIIVRPGFYTETVDLKRDFITLRAEPALGAVIEPPIVDGRRTQGVLVENWHGIIIEGFIVKGATTGISFINASNAVVRQNVVYHSTNGIRLRGTSSGVVENNIVHTNTTFGIHYDSSSDAVGRNVVVRNNLVYANGDWGIFLEPSSTSVGNIIASNTAHFNGRGIRISNGSGAFVDNIITNNAGVGLANDDPKKVLEDFNNVFGNNPQYFSGYKAGLHNINVDPLYIDPDGPDSALGGEGWEDDSFHLSQGRLPGQPVPSPCVDAGSVAVAEATVDGSTATDNLPDIGQLDMGFHYPITHSIMTEFSISSVSAVYDGRKREAITTTYNLQGRLVLGANNDGINPPTERVRIEVNDFGHTLPVGSCKVQAVLKWSCTTKTLGVKSFTIDLTKSSFSMVLEGIPVPPVFPSSVRLRLYLKDDAGDVTKALVRGTLSAP